MVCKILFLDDSATDVEFMKWELDRAGLVYVAMQVANKRDFLDTIQHFEPDIILADYMMPSFNGIYAFRLLKQLNLNIPFILVTGSISEKVALEFKNEGVDEVVMKTDLKRLPPLVLYNLEQKTKQKRT